MTTETEYDEQLENHSPAVLERLQKLLRLGQHASTSEGEVQNAMAAAQKLATKHKIDLGRVKVLDTDPVSKEPFIERAFKYGSKVYKPMEVKYIGWILQEFFGVAVVRQEKFDKERDKAGAIHCRSLFLKIIGRQSDVEFATYAYEYLREVFPKLWRKHKAETGADMEARRSYYYGVMQGINRVLEDARKETEQVEFAALPDAERRQTETSYQLMIVGEEAALKAEVKTLHPMLVYKKDRPGNIYDPAARSAGFQAGLKVKIHRPLESSQKGALA